MTTQNADTKGSHQLTKEVEEPHEHESVASAADTPSDLLPHAFPEKALLRLCGVTFSPRKVSPLVESKSHAASVRNVRFPCCCT